MKFEFPILALTLIMSQSKFVKMKRCYIWYMRDGPSFERRSPANLGGKHFSTFSWQCQCQCRVKTENEYKQSTCLILTILYIQYFYNPSQTWQLHTILTGTILTLYWQCHIILTKLHWFDSTHSHIVLTYIKTDKKCFWSEGTFSRI